MPQIEKASQHVMHVSHPNWVSESVCVTHDDRHAGVGLLVMPAEM